MHHLKSLLVSGYRKFPRAPSFNAAPSKSNTKMQQLDNLYRDISEEWEPDHDDVLMDIKRNDMMAKSETSKGNVSHRSLITSQEKRPKEEKKTASWDEQRKSGGFFIESGKERGYILTEKMKELEIMVEYDKDHVLDVEEVLHHYSRLTCSVYLDIVDKFFTDMYSEFLLPQPSASLNSQPFNEKALDVVLVISIYASNSCFYFSSASAYDLFSIYRGENSIFSVNFLQMLKKGVISYQLCRIFELLYWGMKCLAMSRSNKSANDPYLK